MSSSSATRFLQQENIRLTKENEALQKRAQTLYHYLEMVQELYWASHEMASAKKPIEQLNQLLHKVIDVIGAQDGSLSYLEQDASELVFLIVHGDLANQLPGYRIKHDTGIAGWVVSNRQPIIVNNPRQDWRFSAEVDQEFGFMTQSILSVPILRHSQLIGVISLLNKQDNAFDEADVALLLILSQIAGPVLEDIRA